VTTVEELERVLLDLIEVWQANHADWCCTKGCAAPDGQHFVPDGIHDFLDTVGRGEIPEPVPTRPCTGECSCDVGMYVDSLRAAMEAS
jgi:hypothetical protein